MHTPGEVELVVTQTMYGQTSIQLHPHEIGIAHVCMVYNYTQGRGRMWEDVDSNSSFPIIIVMKHIHGQFIVSFS